MLCFSVPEKSGRTKYTLCSRVPEKWGRAAGLNVICFVASCLFLLMEMCIYLSRSSGLVSVRCLALEVSENWEEVIKMEKDLF